MKNNSLRNKGLIAILMTLIIILSLTSCGEKAAEGNSGPEGVFYNTQRDEDDGKGFQPTDEWMNYGYMTFNSDGTGKWEYALETDIEWKLKGDKLTIVEKWEDDEHGGQDETYKGTWDGEKVTIDVWGYNYLFEKTDGAPSSTGTEAPAPSDGAQNAVLGFYESTGSDMQGTKLDPSGEWLELMEDGRGKWFLGATEDTFAWTLDGNEIHFDVDVANSDIKMPYSATLEGEEITLNTGMLYFFSKGGSAPAQAASDGNAPIGRKPAGKILIPSEWYGVAIVSDSVGLEFEDGQFDVWGSIDTMPNGDAYFELYLGQGQEYFSDPVVSMFIDPEETDWLTPVIGDEDAWVMDLYLEEDDGIQLWTMYDNGALDIYYVYEESEDAYANLRFFIREYGTAWDEQLDPLPDSYADYAKENYTTNGDSKDKIDDEEFTWGIKELGKNGWTFTSTGSMRMEMPEGWKTTSLNEYAMAIVSEKDDETEIRAYLKEYGADEKPEDKNPEIQVTYYSSGATITKDKWGNTDVWYRIEEWSDKEQIHGFAAYSDERFVRFTITIYPSFGTMEEFMKSDAWNLLRTTFELRTP